MIERASEVLALLEEGDQKSGHGDLAADLPLFAAPRPQSTPAARGPSEVEAMVTEALDLTADFVRSTYAPAAKVALRGGSLKEAYQAVRAECDPKFHDYAIYEHCLPFNVARAYDEARDIDTPRIWTDERDTQMWEALQG